jgi:hypothetical protein
MPLTPETGTDDLEQLVASTGLSLKAVETALIDELIPRSLVEVMGTIYETKYGIHGLTRSFLNVEINRWELNTDPSATHGPTDGNPA